MRRVAYIIALCLLFMTVQAQKEGKMNVKATITSITPASYPSMNGLTDFYLELRNDSAFVYLPYIGNVYTPAVSNDGLRFNEPCKGMKTRRTKKDDGTEATFTLRHDIVVYKFRMTAYDDNTFRLYMTPTNAQSCQYHGEWEGW